MAFAKFLVCESSNLWTVALRWGLADGEDRLTVTRNWDDCWEQLAGSPASFVALELRAANLERVVAQLQQVRRRFPFCRIAVMCERSLASCEWLVREAGAAHVAVSTRDLAALIRLADRHLAQTRPPEVGYRQRIQERMPWTPG